MSNPPWRKNSCSNCFTIPDRSDDPEGKWLTNSEIKDVIETCTRQHVSAHKLGAILKVPLGVKKVCRRERNFLGCYFVVRNYERSDYAQTPTNQGIPF
jgi:hypothetical protein